MQQGVEAVACGPSVTELGELFQPAAPGSEPATREINSLASGQCRSKRPFGTDTMSSGPRHAASRCPGRAPPLAGLRGSSRRLGELPLALVPTAALALGGLLPELLEEGAPRVDVDHGDASSLVIAPLSVPLGPSAAVLLVGCHDRGLRCVTRPSLLIVAAPLTAGHCFG